MPATDPHVRRFLLRKTVQKVKEELRAAEEEVRQLQADLDAKRNADIAEACACRSATPERLAAISREHEEALDARLGRDTGGGSVPMSCLTSAVLFSYLSGSPREMVFALGKLGLEITPRDANWAFRLMVGRPQRAPAVARPGVTRS